MSAKFPRGESGPFAACSLLLVLDMNTLHQKLKEEFALQALRQIMYLNFIPITFCDLMDTQVGFRFWRNGVNVS